MVMRWLSRDWLTGQLDDAEYEAADEACRAHNAAIRPLLPEHLRVFAGERDADGYLSLHDCLVEWWTYVPERSLTLQLFCFEEPRRYRRVTLQYRESVELVGADAAQLAGWLDDPKTEFLHDEMDIIENARFEHRHILSPQGEFGVRFSHAALISTPATQADCDSLFAAKAALER
jgi:hypothetical protein